MFQVDCVLFTTAQSSAFWRCIMAILKLENGITYPQVDDIARELIFLA